MPEKQTSSLIFMPTHRDCIQTLPQLFSEAKFASERQHPSIICLIEHNLKDEQSEAHRRALEGLSREGRAKTIHLTATRKQAFIDSLLHGIPRESSLDIARVRSILLPEGISYGSGPDIAFLLAVSLRCTYVHRRDSDVFLDERRQYALPIELELGAIGQSVEDIDLVRQEGDTSGLIESRVRLVGTSSFGSPTLDRRDLFAAGEEYAVAFQQLGRPGVASSVVRDEAVAYLQEEPATRYDRDFYELDINGRVEMEACCFWEAFTFIPEMTTDIMGCDYMIKDAIWKAGLPSVFHTRKMQHRYEPAREEQSELELVVGYALRDVQYIQMGRIWQEQGRLLRDGPDRLYDEDGFHAEVYADAFDSAALGSAKVLEEVREGAQRVYSEAASATTGGLQGRLRAVADAISSLGADLDAHVVQAVDDFTYLISAWPTLVGVAGECEVVDDDYYISS